MFKPFKPRAVIPALCLVGATACSNESSETTMTVESDMTDETTALAANLEIAESMIDAFYSFDASTLQPILSNAGESEAGILSYQAWAEGGNYIVLNRAPCVSEDGSENKIQCAITRFVRHPDADGL